MEEIKRFDLRNGTHRNGGRTGRGSAAQGATTRYLSRIITVLMEIEYLGITDLSNACLCGNGNRAIRDALQWLISNKIVVKMGLPSDGRTYYKLNPKWVELRNDIT